MNSLYLSLRHAVCAYSELRFAPQWLLLNMFGDSFFKKGEKYINVHQPTIIAFPGWMERNSIFLRVGKFFEKKGFNFLVFKNLSWNTKAIKQTASEIAPRIIEISQLIYGKPIILWGHSQGGLHALELVRRLGKQYIALCICTGTPFSGTPMATFIRFTPAGRDMIPKSPFLLQLKEEFTKNEYPPVYSFYSKLDKFVPPENSFMPFATNLELLDSLGHPHVLFEKCYWKIIEDIICSHL